VVGIDADAKMLEQAAQRLALHRDRIQLRQQDFLAELPVEQNGYFAALALHHVQDLAAKQALYRQIYGALVSDGVFVNADAMFDESTQARRRWMAHLISMGFSEAEACNHLEGWKKEDKYFPLESELDLLRRAGFVDCDVVWRYGPMAIVTGKKSRRSRS
jgi:SAM-dependent methyltransferase